MNIFKAFKIWVIGERVPTIIEGLPEEEKEPVELKIHHTIVPQSYLDNTVTWDSYLYNNQEVYNDNNKSEPELPIENEDRYDEGC